MEERVGAVVKDSEEVRVMRACIDELRAERASLNAKTEKQRVVRDNLPARIGKQEVSAAKCQRQRGLVLRAAQSLKSRPGAGEDRGIKAEARAHEAMENRSELHALVESLNQTGGGEHAGVAALDDANLVCVG